MSNPYDVCVIGAGPAGLMAAKHLQNQGINFLLVETKKMPRSKACADVLTSKAIRELKSSFSEVMETLEREGLLHPIWGTTLSIPNKPIIDIPFRSLDDSGGPSCYTISREDLDHSMWQFLAHQSPSRLLDGVRVMGHERRESLHHLSLSNGGTVDCRVCVLATGSALPQWSRSNIEQREANRHTAIGIRTYCSGLDLPAHDRCYLYLDSKWMPGGFYIAPLSGGMYNVNMVVRKDKMISSSLDLKEELQRAIKSKTELARIFSKVIFHGDIRGSSLKLATLDRPMDSYGMILTGDAAGLIDLISANGIPQALISGRMAGLAAASILQGTSEEKAIESYSKAVSEAIASDISLGRKLSPWLGSSWVSSLILDGLGKVAKSDFNTEGTLERMVYADDPWKELLYSLNPLRSM